MLLFIQGALLATLAAVVLTAPVRAQAPADLSGAHPAPSPTVRAVQRAGPVSLDGRLDDAAWASAPPATGFMQSAPREGEPATQRTEVRFLFDDDALYVGARMYDSLGARGVRTRLVRRDANTDADYIQVVFDTYHNHLGRTIFQLNPSGVKYDAGQASPYADESWDPVWEGAASIDSLGWSAEMRIPFSQLRFSRSTEQTWGVQLWRGVTRLNETQMWSFWLKNETGGPSRFGHLEGLRVGDRPRHLEVLPYVTARAARILPPDPGDPFSRPRESNFRVGGDVKYLLTSNLTLDATINPDFGQVEVDPAVVNLTQFETFFPEKRPFFVEGGGIFGFGNFNCFICSNVSSLDLFYSRRIGRPPQGPAGGRYADVPENATILGAAKVTGRTVNGWTVGLLDAVTRRERARALRIGEFDDTHPGEDSLFYRRDVEPFSNYFVGRVKRDARGGNVELGGIFTSVIRQMDEPALVERIPRTAHSLGGDWVVQWRQRRYSWMGQAALSQVAGDSLAMLRLQNAPQRYFQRPDREHGSNRIFSNAYDPGATSLSGFAGYSRIAKDAGNWLWEAQTNIRSPGFEVNDISFLTRADYVWASANLFRNWTIPTRRYRSLNLIGGSQRQWNFDGDVTDAQFHMFGGAQLPNYWNTSLFAAWRPTLADDRLTRGGPVVKRASSYSLAYNLGTDRRKTIVLSTNPFYARNTEGMWGAGVNLDVTYRPVSNVQVTMGPEWNRSSSSAQYLSAQSGGPASFYGVRYVFSDLKQQTLSMNTRINVTFTPTLTLELFAQPLIVGADFSNFKEFDRPRDVRKSVYGRDIGTITELWTPTAFDDSGTPTDSVVAQYRIDPDAGGGAAPFTIGNPDFNFRSLRGNAVLRWEYRPGSTLFVVWTQMRSGSAPVGDLDFTRDREALLSAHPDNVFAVKLTWWMGR